MVLTNIADYRTAAKRRLAKVFFDYLDGGSYDEATLRANVDAFGRWSLQPRALAALPARDLGADFLGGRHALPLMLGPVGFAGMMRRNGEIAAARAAGSLGIPTCLSSFAVSTLEDVAKAASTPFYYQLYMLRDRAVCEDMVARAEAAGADALFLTVDTVVSTRRERDTRNGFRGVTRVTPKLAFDFARHPGWCLDMLPAGIPRLENLRDYGLGRSLLEQASNLGKQIDPSLGWADVAWLRELWKGRLVLKGIMHPDDARRAAGMGADAIVVSNHGGRQLDQAPSSLFALPAIAKAVGRSMDIIYDGGVRRGMDVVKALALGAHAVGLGRAYCYGLAVAGAAGVEAVVELLRSEIDVSLALMGFASVAELREAGGDALVPAA